MSRFSLDVEAVVASDRPSARYGGGLHHAVGCFRLDFKVGSCGVIEVLVEQLSLLVRIVHGFGQGCSHIIRRLRNVAERNWNARHGEMKENGRGRTAR